MVKTHGLTHVALAVRNAERAFALYEKVLGVVAVYRKKGFIQAQTPGTRDVIVFDETAARPGESGGIVHFGFRLVDPSDIGAAVQAVRDAGGTVTGHGEFVHGEPYVFFTDLDGYGVEIWYELPTPIDPDA